MKTLYCKSAFLLAVIFTATISLKAQALREENQKDFTATSATELSIENQFGNITITDWDQNKVTVTYIIEVTNSDEAKAKKLMDKIKVEFKEEGNKIIVKTIIGEMGNLNLHNDKGDKQSFRIDYFIKCPKNIKVSLENQFGDLIIASLAGSFNADLQFGSLNATSLTGPETKIDMQFGDVTIGTVKDVKIEVQHCDAMKISECGNLKIDAQFSKIEIGKAVSIKADVNNCEITVDLLSEMLKMESNMGNVKIGNVSAAFKSIEVEQNMGDLAIGIDPKAGYKLNAEVNMGSIKVPEGMKVSKDKEDDIPGVTVEKVTGTFGNGISTVKVNCNMGSVKIK
jgi:hypothetical protein